MKLGLVVVLTVLTHLAFVGSRLTAALSAIALGATPLTVGVLMALFAALPMLLAVYAGRRIDRHGARGALLAGGAGLAAAILLPAAWPRLPALFLAAPLMGCAFVVYHVALNNVVGALGAAADRAANFSWLALGFSIGGFIGPLAAGFAIDGFGHRAAFLALAAFPAIAAAIVWRTRAQLAAPAAGRLGVAGGGGVLELLRDRRLRGAFVASGVLATGWDLYAFVTPVYGTRIGLSAATIGAVMGTFALATFIVRLGMPALSRRVREWPMVVAAMGVAGASYALFPAADSALPLAALSFALGLGLGCAQPFIMSLLYAASPPGRQGEVIGVRTTMLSVSTAFVPLSMGALGAAFGMAPVFWTMSAIMALGAAYAWRRVE